MTKHNTLTQIAGFINQDEGKPFELLKDVTTQQNHDFLSNGSITLSTNQTNKKVFISFNNETPNEPHYNVIDCYSLATGYDVFYLERGDF